MSGVLRAEPNAEQYLSSMCSERGPTIAVVGNVAAVMSSVIDPKIQIEDDRSGGNDSTMNHPN